MTEVSSTTQVTKIVFVDDYHWIRVGIAAYLENEDDIHIVAEADTAEEGIKKINQHKPDLVIMDVTLPGMNGIDATRHIKKTFPDMKVVMLTSHEDEETVIASLGAGANAYCLKDISPKRLVEVIHSVMDGAAWLDPVIATVALAVFSETLPSKPTEEAQKISLGEREREVLRLLATGKNNNEIADQLYVSVHTVKTQVSTILQKLMVNDRVQAAVKAITTGIIKLEEVQFD
jgi:two-component system, NarL family, response regulator LiaR